jgi:preprotein translocase subunit SecF
MVKKFRKTDFLRGKIIKPETEQQNEQVETEESAQPVIESEKVKEIPKQVEMHHSNSKGIRGIFERKYKLLLWIPFILLILAMAQIGFQVYTTGDFVKKGITLSGGVSVTIFSDSADTNMIQLKLKEIYPKNDINVRTLTNLGETTGFIVEADLDGSKQDTVEKFVADINKFYPLTKENYTLEVMGASLGKSFFRETLIVVFISFTLMGIVVFIMFRTFAPSMAVILCAFSDILTTLAIFNLLGYKLSTAGVAGFLMLIGYSVDTDILLSTKVLKTKEGTVDDRVNTAMKTGLMMTSTTIFAVIVGLIFAQSEVIRQIMSIVLIGVFVDMIYTWIQNVGILKLYLEKVKA